MAIPSNVTVVRCSRSYVDSAGAPVVGSVVFEPVPVRLVDLEALVTVVGSRIAMPLVAGRVEVDLIPTDHPKLSPIGWSWKVTEVFPGGRAPYFIPVPMSAVVGGFDFTAAASDASGSSTGSSGTVVPSAPINTTDLLAKSANLADLPDKPAARTNLGLGSSATRAVGTAAGTVTAGDDLRLSDVRTPTAHQHPLGDVTGLTAALAAKADLVGGKVPSAQVTAVKSVNGQTTADIVLGAADVGATPAAHATDQNNPHGVTKAQVGLGSVDNVSAAALRDRSTHTNTQSALTVDPTSDRLWLTAAERTKIASASSGGGLVFPRPPIGGVISVARGNATNPAGEAIGQATFGQMVLPEGTWDAAIARISAVASNGAAKIVGYAVDPSTGNLGTLLFDTASVPTTSGGNIVVTLPTALVVPAGGIVIWVTVVNTGAASAAFWGTNIAYGLPRIFNSTAIDIGGLSVGPAVRLTGLTGAAPSPATGTWVESQFIPTIAMRRSA